ncbi:hypothetical protein Tco_0643093, partial [Tanacetum coccineum]
TSPGVPSNLNNWDTALSQPFDLSIHDFNRFFNKLKLVIKVKSIQRNG